MRNLYNMSESEKEKLELTSTNNCYCFKENEELLGYAIINYLETSDIYIYILENKRGNGYGNELFAKVLQNVKAQGLKTLEIVFPLENMIMARIISKNGGVEETRKDGIVKYKISIS